MTTIRAAVTGDEELLAKLNGFVQELHLQRRPDHFRQTHLTELATWFKFLLEKPTARVWIAEEQGRPVGYVLAIFQDLPENPFTHARSWLEIDQIAVDSNHRRRGIGRALVLKAIAEARAAGTSWPGTLRRLRLSRMLGTNCLTSLIGCSRRSTSANRRRPPLTRRSQ
jgi:ribosomal protein S18 acetylase RimI-like enzyme